MAETATTIEQDIAMEMEKQSQESPGLLEMWRGEHVCIAGVTGSGKTVLSRSMLARLMRRSPTTSLIIVDPKLQFQFPCDLTVVKLSHLNRVRPAPTLFSRTVHRTILVRLGPEESDVDSYDRLFRWIYERGRKQPDSSQRVHIDDLSVVATAQQYPMYLRALYQQGRGLGIGVSANMQRAFTVPRFAQSEATGGFYKFRLMTRDDQARMAEYMGPSIMEPRDYPANSIHTRGPYSFFYYRWGMQQPVERVLDLQE